MDHRVDEQRLGVGFNLFGEVVKRSTVRHRGQDTVGRSDELIGSTTHKTLLRQLFEVASVFVLGGEQLVGSRALPCRNDGH